MELSEEFAWQGRTVRWARLGSGPPVVFCHGTPWSSALWEPFARALSGQFECYLWDMPGYGRSSKHGDHRVSLDVQGELLADLLDHWGMTRPHVVAHDYGGVVSLRAHLLHGAIYASLALVDVVALAPWGSEFLRLVRDNAAVFAALPAAIHRGLVRTYIAGASYQGLDDRQLDRLAEPWLDAVGQAALYRQMVQADQVYTDEVEARYPTLDLPVLVAWGTEDAWVPVEHARRLAELIPGARLELIEGAGHLVQLDEPVALATTLQRWLSGQGAR